MYKLNPIYHSELQIDKDILQWGQIYKKYSPSTCCLIPGKLNTLIAVSNSKSDILQLSEFYMKDKAITEEIYNAIINNIIEEEM